MFMVAKIHHSLSVPLLRSMFHKVTSRERNNLSGTNYQENALLPTTILTSSSPGSTDIYTTYSHNIRFILPPFHSVTTISFSNPLNFMILG